MRRGGRQEFTRAEALLAGKRVVAKGKQEQEGIGKSKPTTRAFSSSSSSSSSRCLSVIPSDSDLSNLSSSKSSCVGRENGGPADTTRLAQPGSRFLKQKPQNVEMDDIQQGGLGPVTRMGLGADSKGRSNAILRKLAQIESKIQSRKTKQSTEQIPAMDVELSLSESSNDFELRTGGLKFLKKTARLKESVKAQTENVTLADVTGDSEEAADRHRQEVPPKSKGQEDKFKFKLNGKLLPETSSNSRCLPEERQVNRPLYHSPYSPNRDTRASHVASCSSPPSMKDSPADTISQNRSSNYQRKSLSERSIIRSLDELFSEVTDIHNDISTNSDFRVNILSLDELEPCQKTELKEEVIQEVEKLNKNLGTVLYPGNPQSLFKTSDMSLEEEENQEETEISEQLSSSSAGYSPCKEESLNNTQYSEDFERSSISPTSKGTGGESSCEKSGDLLGASVHSIQSSPCCPAVASKGIKAIKKIEVKEAAVQTGSFSLAYHRLLQYDVPAVVGHAVQQSSAEAPCISSHKLNMEVIEALSVYNPSISALNNMLKQNLLLIQQSIEINRHLHASFVASLEEEEYHYHTLEEAKMYIQQHKPLPLTMEQALQELKEYEQMAS